MYLRAKDQFVHRIPATSNNDNIRLAGIHKRDRVIHPSVRDFKSSLSDAIPLRLRIWCELNFNLKILFCIKALFLSNKYGEVLRYRKYVDP